MRYCKFASIVALIALVLSLGATAAAQRPLEIRGNQKYALAFGLSGSRFLYVQTATGEWQGAPATWLFYLLDDPDNGIFHWGWGYIPNSALTGNLPQTMQVDIDTR